MATKNDLVQILKELLLNRFAPKPNYISGLLGDGVGNVVVPERPDYSFVRFNRSTTQTFEIFNKNVSPVHGWPVLIGEFPWQPGLTQVVATDWGAYEQVGWGDTGPEVSAHGESHEWRDGNPGSDVINVYTRALVPLRTYSPFSGSTTVYAAPLEYEYNETGTFFPGTPGINFSDLIDSIPTGTQMFAGVYLDPADNLLHVITGTQSVYSPAVLPPFPEFPGGTIPSARIRLRGYQIGVAEQDIYDARRLLRMDGNQVGPAGGDLTGTYPNPRVAGLFGYSLVNSMPSEGNVLMYSGSAWRPIPAASGGSWPFSNIITVDSSGSGDYTTITAAITGATAGDTIVLNSETFTESVGIDKSVHLHLPAGATITSTAGSTVLITAGGVILSGEGSIVQTSAGDAVNVSAAGDFAIHGITLDGDTNDLTISSAGATANLVSPTLTNGTITNGGTIQGWYIYSGDVYAFSAGTAYVIPVLSAWPGDGKAMIDQTEYASLGAAFTAATAGDEIRIGFGTHTLSASLAIDKNISIVGPGRTEATIAYGSDTVIEIGNTTSSTVRLYNLTVSYTGTNPTSVYPLNLVAGSLYCENVDIREESLNNAAEGYGFNIDGGDAEFLNCRVFIANAGAATSNSAITSTGGTQTWRGGVLDGQDYDISSGGGTIKLVDVELINGPILGAVSGYEVSGTYIYAGQRYDLYLHDYSEGNHFADKYVGYPPDWTEIDAAATTNTNTIYSFWYLRGTSAETSWRYRKQTSITIESLASNTWASFMFGPILFRDANYSADLSYYFGMYRNSGGIDTNTYSRVQVYWNSGSSIWQIRGQENDGSTAHNGTFVTMDQNPLSQPFYIRFLVRNDTAKTTRQYFGTSPVADSHQLLLSQAPTSAPTWGQVWLDIQQSRGAGNEDYMYIGAVDYLQDAT